jgi:hypothetical protein
MRISFLTVFLQFAITTRIVLGLLAREIKVLHKSNRIDEKLNEFFFFFVKKKSTFI